MADVPGETHELSPNGLIILAFLFDAGQCRKSQGETETQPAVIQFRAIKKRPKPNGSGRLGSPPPELPNHVWIVARTSASVNVTLVIRFWSTR